MIHLLLNPYHTQNIAVNCLLFSKNIRISVGKVNYYVLFCVYIYMEIVLRRMK
jgi:hypothetical protein